MQVGQSPRLPAPCPKAQLRKSWYHFARVPARPGKRKLGDTMLKSLLVRVCGVFMGVLYAGAKIAPMKKGKVTFISRQSNEPGLDFRLLQNELSARPEVTETAVVCRRFGSKPGGLAADAGAILRSIGHLATSDVCVIDSFWPAVCMLRHRDALTVVQIWHSLGKVKQSGLITVGRPGGQPPAMARAVHMHEGYDRIVAGAPAWNRFYCESFGCTEDKLINVGLPRMDYIRERRDDLLNRFFDAYPQLKGKPIVLYAPTFRRDAEGQVATVDVSKLADDAYELIVKSHPNQILDDRGAFTCPDFTTIDLLAVADVIVTDYSAVALEAAWAHVRTLYYLYDCDEYLARNGLNVNPRDEIPSCCHTTAEGTVAAVKRALAGDYPQADFDAYRAKWLLPDDSRPTKAIADFVCSQL